MTDCPPKWLNPFTLPPNPCFPGSLYQLAVVFPTPYQFGRWGSERAVPKPPGSLQFFPVPTLPLFCWSPACWLSCSSSLRTGSLRICSHVTTAFFQFVVWPLILLFLYLLCLCRHILERPSLSHGVFWYLTFLYHLNLNFFYNLIYDMR